MTQPWMNTYWTGERAALYKANAKKIPLPDKSVHCVVTSPPYWGLRDYGLGQWQGGDAECEHRNETAHQKQGVTSQRKGRSNIESQRNDNFQQECGHCGAVQQSAGIGLEPTLDEWVENIVGVMREVKRVLRDDGTCWLNLGDAYATSPPGNKKSWASSGLNGAQSSKYQDTLEQSVQQRRSSLGQGLAAKNLLAQPWRAALALQDDGANVPALRTVERVIEEFHDAFEGEEIPPKALAILDRLAAEYAEAKGQSWTLRSAIVWHKPNPMPEAVLDRPTSSYEMVFLLTKSGAPTFWTHRDGRGTRTSPPPDYQIVDGKRVNMWRSHDYFYDAEAIKETTTGNAHAKRKDGSNVIQKGSDPNNHRPGTWVDTYTGIPKRNARNVWQIPTQPRSDAHFATYPDELVRRCILAGTSERGVCGECGAPWTRMVDHKIVSTRPIPEPISPKQQTADSSVKFSGQKYGGHIGSDNQTLGWQPTCGCNAAVVPALVLDPFVGSGTTVAVAQSLGRCGVGLDLNEEYLDIAVKHITSPKYDWIPEVCST